MGHGLCPSDVPAAPCTPGTALQLSLTEAGEAEAGRRAALLPPGVIAVFSAGTVPSSSSRSTQTGPGRQGGAGIPTRAAQPRCVEQPCGRLSGRDMRVLQPPHPWVPGGHPGPCSALGLCPREGAPALPSRAVGPPPTPRDTHSRGKLSRTCPCREMEPVRAGGNEPRGEQAPVSLAPSPPGRVAAHAPSRPAPPRPPGARSHCSPSPMGGEHPGLPDGFWGEGDLAP